MHIYIQVSENGNVTKHRKTQILPWNLFGVISRNCGMKAPQIESKCIPFSKFKSFPLLISFPYPEMMLSSNPLNVLCLTLSERKNLLLTSCF